jgi:hypothetical protein
MTSPLTQPLPRPYPDNDTHTVLNDAVDALAWQRSPHGPGDPVLTVHLLLSLQQQIAARLPSAVADARLDGRSWTDLAHQIGTTPAATRRRYGHSEPPPIA